MGRRRAKGRKVNGILLLNKPQGISSNKALQQVKQLFFAAKAGHTGALDPLATGMLPICFGEATKFSQFLLESDKGYRVVAKLGVRTDSCDSTGETIETKPANVSEKKLLKALDQFRGDILQVPSMFSALKHKGQPLYKLARQGIEIEREAREISVFHLELLRFEEDEVELEIECSKGTYIRNIVDDLGQVLECGAHVTELHRSFVADYPVEDMVTMEQLEADRDEGVSLDQYLLPMDSSVMHLDEAVLDADSEHYFLQGQAVVYPDLEQGDYIRVYNEDDEFIGIAEVDKELMLAPKRLVVR
ncbi:tRNA pseudouridine(55) synthase TruB [Aliikangiella coralliicola]|uniref:tRNA pseudouridine synthase B n=1 Tax=Aliikangiella coralliicola TaxID=2592383 RepID=A0A545UED0_9GAMM|nr:tRNA pseudouridine(55) synthase TruB [Aliikangiella coralliicola]TQV87818.1 tRNA pseudouridine(55) synthase TruB [Aliikangiella coralliicola]